MYSNNNTFKTENILKPFIDNGYVTLINWQDSELLKVEEKEELSMWYCWI